MKIFLLKSDDFICSLKIISKSISYTINSNFIEDKLCILIHHELGKCNDIVGRRCCYDCTRLSSERPPVSPHSELCKTAHM